MQEEVTRIRASGEPISTEDLYAFHQVPAHARDITPLWQEAFDSFDENQFSADTGNLPVVGNGEDFENAFDTPDKVTQGEQFLAKYDLTIQKTLRAAEVRGECRFPVSFDEGMQAELPHAVKLRLVARLLTVRMRVCKARGDIPAALESLHAMFAAARTHENAPLIIEQMVRFAVSGSALHETETLLNEYDLDEAELVQLERDVRSLKIEEGLTLALIGERSLGYHSFHHLGQLADSPRLDAHDGELSLPVDCRFFLEQMERFIIASRDPYPEALRAADQVDSRFREVMDDPLQKLSYMVTLLIAPAYRAGFDAAARQMARRELVSCAIAAERFRVMHGRPPQDLEELVPTFLPATPMDPFIGQPVRFQAGNDELVFYSVGANAKDDVGIENDRSCEPDIVVRLRRR